MKRFLCLSLCLGLMVSACKKKSLEESVNKARAECKASGGSSGSGTTAVTKKDKAAVIKACLPLINNHLKGAYTAPQDYLVFRQSTAFTTTPAKPALLISTFGGLDMAFTVANGIGNSAALATTNLEKMGKDADVQAQFVDREANKGKGYRVFISAADTMPTLADDIPQAAAGKAYPDPGANAIYKIYDRTGNVKAGIQLPIVTIVESQGAANNAEPKAGWYDCELDTTTQNVTLMYTSTVLT